VKGKGGTKKIKKFLGDRLDTLYSTMPAGTPTINSVSFRHFFLSLALFIYIIAYMHYKSIFKDYHAIKVVRVGAYIHRLGERGEAKL
jgi:hypothetical protein